MAEIAAELVAVEKALWSGTATAVIAETTEGEIGVLPGHEPLLGQLVENGVVIIRTTEGEKLVAAVQGGFLSVSSKKITVLADSAVWADEVDQADAEARVREASSEEEKSRAESELRAVKRSKEK
ncbi:F0F1 ATP synthase subunit epsilon [Corynebacterium urealyticum]|uniref:ATP synthase epsilon chain n=1 Tax=Corynebacterium urealyticum (strain ATCC 43042 / DSM 7109) TaxID=504474 RepID=ATPE_CORU7|nr:F0F1 ATP synthase subunit epsilon [Corynebacterium urealyticum]B1VFY8.1 RecName: Full=ATP synthase epsilon chain; AltName: Full=ATP synthase F1 sector epsilon subunit; AltName: Full=F-ATPase epsilon subunit [Corynebacterium urealyticum DSM 7109]AGE36299.1 ATP synthase epsilon chain [Corynebacterium urealyticum DSM 7111]QQB07967.1 F0F1 ATP synthase subunit epsilon [Corynebacterium urealyticum]QQC41845.1 F0F1 ATP synthase subunit epsilon [Corynebacterium urealyticum]QQE50467.1 F0F1 ATP syntha